VTSPRHGAPGIPAPASHAGGRFQHGVSSVQRASSQFWGVFHRGSFWGVAAAVLLALALRIPFVDVQVYPDEGGYLLAARGWQRGGPNLYGAFFVDRPPLLMAFWRVVADLGGVDTARWLACAAVTVLVLSGAWAGHLLGGSRGAVLAALTAAALASGPVLGAHEVDGELLAVPLVMLSCALSLSAVTRDDAVGQVWRATLLGLVGSCAVLVKQNFVDALVFAVVLVSASAINGALGWRAAGRILGCAFGAVAVVAALTMLWAGTTGPDVSGLLYAMYGFRSAAGQVVLAHSLSAPWARLLNLFRASARSGVLVMIVLYLGSAWWGTRRRDPSTVAIIAMGIVGLAGVAFGASYWVHYLIGLVPVLALSAGTFGRPGGLPLRRAANAVVAFVVASAAAFSVFAAGSRSSGEIRDGALVRLLKAAGSGRDSVVMTYGHANVIEASGLRPGYPYLWSLPMRTLDPRLTLLTATLSGRQAPEWLVRWDDFDSWNIDASGRLADTVRADYRRVATVCGADVYLHVGLVRTVPSMPGLCSADA
jgi:hypothetical protein